MKQDSEKNKSILADCSRVKTVSSFRSSAFIPDVLIRASEAQMKAIGENKMTSTKGHGSGTLLQCSRTN